MCAATSGYMRTVCEQVVSKAACRAGYYFRFLTARAESCTMPRSTVEVETTELIRGQAQEDAYLLGIDVIAHVGL